jgi:hypothetical protein
MRRKINRPAWTVPEPKVPPVPESATYRVALSKDGRLGSVVLPVPITKGDVRALRLWVDYLDGCLDDEPVAARPPAPPTPGVPAERAGGEPHA